MGPLLFLLLPVLTSCADMSLVFKDFFPNITGLVDIQGNISHQMTDNEMANFFLDDEVLLNIAEKYAPKKPKKVYLHGPTENGSDVYAIRELKPVTVVVTPVAYDIFCNSSKEVVLHSIKISHKDASKHVISSTVTDSVSTKWFTAGPIEGSHDMHYSVVPHHNAPNFDIESKWGVDFNNSRKTVFSHDVELFLDKDEVRDLILSVTKVNVEVVVIFSISLEGNAVCDVDSTFHDYPITKLFEKASHPDTAMASLVISFGIHTDGTMIVKDAKTGITKLHYGVYPAVSK